MNTKHRARRMMQTTLSSEAQRIHACLELATMGYSQELAVTMSEGKKRPLTSADVVRQTGLKAPNVDRGLRELEANGLAERRPLNPDIPLQKGNIGLYSWAVPRAPKQPIVLAHDNNPPGWMPASWTDPESTVYRTLKRFKITPSPNFHPTNGFVDEVEAAARDYKNAEDVLVAKLRLSGATANGAAPSLLLERNGKEQQQQQAPEPSPEPAQAVVVAPPPEPEIEQVYEALSQHGQTTRKTCAILIASCRKNRPGCRAEWIAALIRGFTYERRRIDNPVGLILRQLPLRVVDYSPPPLPETEEQRQRKLAAKILETPEEWDAPTVQWAKEVTAT